MEPALTNIGIVLPEPGYLDGVRELTRRHGTLLINDETHTFCAGPGGATAAWGLEPDMVTVGKAIGGGIPAAAFGLTAELADRLLGRRDLDLVDMGGVGGTLAGNPLSITAVCATLREVLRDEVFGEMSALAERFAAGVDGVISRHGLPWSVSPAGSPGRVPVHFPGAAHRQRGRGRVRSRARRLPAHLPGQPGHPAHPVPQHGADVPGHQPGRRGPAH